MRLSVILCVLLAVAVFVSGCGGSSGSGTTANGTGVGKTDSESGQGKGASGKQGASGRQNAATNEEVAGGSGGETSEGKGEAGGAPEVRIFIKEADEICNKVPESYGKKLKALEKAKGGKKVSTKEGNLKAAVPPLYTAAEELEALTPPSGDEEKIEAIIDALEAAAKGLEAKPESPLSGPKSPFAEFQKLTQEYGFRICTGL